MNQRNVFNRTKNRLQYIISGSPAIGDLIRRIQRYKQRDMVILAFVIASCVFALILYIVT